MAEPIYLVQGDNRPQIKATITRSDTGAAVDISGSTTRLFFRKKYTTTLLATLTNVGSSGQGASGICLFNFGDTDLNIDAGEYEGEIEVVFDSGARETVYETIDFVLREDFS